MSPGIPDSIFAGHGFTLFVEFKVPKGKLTPYQKFFRKTWTDNGGIALVWRSVDEAFDWLVSVGLLVETETV